MCTAITLQSQDHYFGRNLDLNYSYKETIVITPRNYPLLFRRAKMIPQHYAMIGTAYVPSCYPLYYEAVNEYGLAMAGLNFPENAYYKEEETAIHPIAPFELIPWILSQCVCITEALSLLSDTCLVKEAYHEDLPLTPLHWILSDRDGSVTLEPMKDGLRIINNPIGVLTNNPPFEMQMLNLNRYMSLSADPPENHFAPSLPLAPYSNGMGALGLPGDWSSSSRFVRASFAKMNSVCGSSEEESVHQFFHILDTVSFPRGSVRLKKDMFEITQYSCCCNTDKGIYYYKTYENSRITAVSMHLENLDADRLIGYPMIKTPDCFRQNEKGHSLPLSPFPI